MYCLEEQIPGKYNISSDQDHMLDMGSQAQGTTTSEVSSLHLNAMELKTKSVPFLNTMDVPSEDCGVNSEWSVECGPLIHEDSGPFFNTMDLQDWNMDTEADGALMPEKSTKSMKVVLLDNEDWHLDPESDGSLTPGKSAKEMNIVEGEPEDLEGDNKVQEMPAFHPSCLKFLTDPHAERFLSQYTLGNLLGTGGFGSVYEGIRKKDGQQVAIKYVSKEGVNKYIALPGESCKLPLEVALMQAVSKAPQCEEILQLLDWYDMPDYVLLVLERPNPCMDVFSFCESQGGRLQELTAKLIVLQVIMAALHCHECGVFHRDIKAENILINTGTFEVKLIDFGCGDLRQDTPYHRFAGTPTFWPPEWIVRGRYYAEPTTVWSIGILLFSLVCGKMPFRTSHEIVAGVLDFTPGLSEDCCHLIKWCLDRDQTKRPSLIQISKHEWFRGL